MAEPVVNILGPTVQDTYNVVIEDAHGFHVMSLSPEALILLEEKLAPLTTELKAGRRVRL